MTPEEISIYQACLEKKIRAINPSLLLKHIWDKDLIESEKAFNNAQVGTYSTIEFLSVPDIVRLELKLYWATMLCEKSKKSVGRMARLIKAHVLLERSWPEISNTFNVQCIAEIPHPEISFDEEFLSSNKGEGHNKELIEIIDKRHGGDLQSNSGGNKYKSEYMTTAGGIHKGIVVNRERLISLNSPNVLFINDLFSINDRRLKKIHPNDNLNFLKLPDWLRGIARDHVLRKIDAGDWGPGTVKTYIGKITPFRDFMCEKFENPSPQLITDKLIGDDFFEWGCDKNLAGKNWWLDPVAMLKTGADIYPDTWPTLGVENDFMNRV